MPIEEEEEEENGQILSLGDSRIERVRSRLAILSMLKVRVVDHMYPRPYIVFDPKGVI